MCEAHHNHNPRSSSRRAFIKNSGALAMLSFGLGGVPQFLTQAAARAMPPLPYKKGKTLVCIFQRGAMDGLMAVTPFTDAELRKARPNLFMDAAKAAGDAALIDLDGRFGLHPAMRPFHPLFSSGQLAIVHGTGSPNTTRSHFDAQDYMESGTPFSKGTPSGWLNRAVGLMGHDASPFRAVSVTNALPRSLYGPQEALAISNLQEFAIQLRGNPQLAGSAAKSFEELYDQTTGSLLGTTGRESFEAMKMLKKENLAAYKPAYGAEYPNSPLGRALMQVAQLIKMDVGLQVAFAECGGWDTHNNQGRETGVFARNVADLSASIHAFWTDLTLLQDNVELMTMTEFGRTVRQNGTAGTDHGRGSCLFVLGNHVQGGKVYGDVPVLAIENLEDRRDLPVTTDFRTVFTDVAASHLGIDPQGKLFPGYDGKRLKLHKNG